MIKEERAVLLAILTLVIYSGIMLFEKGVFIFPFPLNEFVILIVSAQFTIWNWKKYPRLVSLIFITAVLNLISTQFFWTFLLNDQKMEQLTESLLLDFLKIGFYICLIIWAIISILKTPINQKYILAILIALGFMVSAALSDPIYEVISLIGMLLISILHKAYAPTHLIWILFVLLHIMKMVMLYLS